MEPFKEGAESVKDEIVKRVRSSFFGAFVLAWSVVNYEFLIVVFSEGNYAERIGYIARHLSYGSNLQHSFGLPLALAAVSSLALPIVNLVTDLWSKFVDIVGTRGRSCMEANRWRSDPELRARIREKTYEADSMRYYARGLLIQNSAMAARLFELGTLAADFDAQAKHDACKLPGVSVDGASALPEGFKRALENTGFSRHGYETLKQLRDEAAIGESQLVANFAPDLDYGRLVLSMMHGSNLVRLVWDSGREPSYELSIRGKALLELIADKYTAAFSVRNPDTAG